MLVNTPEYAYTVRMSTRNALLLKRYGYLPCGLDVRPESIRLFQTMMGLRDDGNLGPITSHALTDRCSFPDQLDPSLMSLDYSSSLFGPEEGLIVCNQHTRLMHQQNEAGSGSWPHQCHDADGVTISVDKSRLPDFLKDDWDDLLNKAIHEFGQVGLKLKIVPLNGPRANIRIWFRTFSGSVIGMAEFNNRSCGDSVFCTFNHGYRGSMKRWLNLILHELGHNMNLQHSRDIMAPSINDSPNKWVERDSTGRITYRDNSYYTLSKFFGGQPVDPPKPPAPDPPPKPPPEDPMDFIALLTLVLDLLENCNRDGRSREYMREQLRNPGRFARMRMERGVRREHGLNRRAWRRERAEIMEPLYTEAREATDAELDDLIDEAIDD